MGCIEVGTSVHGKVLGIREWVLVPIPNSYFLMPDALGPASLLVRGRPGTVSPTWWALARGQAHHRCAR